MADLVAGVEEHYRWVQLQQAQPGAAAAASFRVDSFQLYDRQAARWVALCSAAQLAPGCQIYCFQPEGCDGGADRLQAYLPSARQVVRCRNRPAPAPQGPALPDPPREGRKVGSPAPA
eukprot:TRINITY_DN8581_c0_g1_i2.p6 TRINITY_DN8581_c0_g1~~TRINITY_DN8581_c0_g1_i2.p6  ORF type:complete len:118 (+),score=34.52 TRINITY_DN8581_c0_g1_i2:1106-1459(+)